MEEARKAIDEGLIRHMSFSFHSDPKDMPYLIEQGGIFSSVLLQYKLLDHSNEEAIAYLAQQGLGVVAMGPVAGAGWPRRPPGSRKASSHPGNPWPRMSSPCGSCSATRTCPALCRA